MARTFNRAPLQFNTPSSSDLKNYFFNHYNWKGVCKNDNFLAVDQETFNDANNVYVNSEGLLRSRPALKRSKKMQQNNILKTWIFNEVLVVLTADLMLSFYKNMNVVFSLNVETKDIKLKLINNHVYIFSKLWLKRVNVDNFEVSDGKIYIPNTVFDAFNVKTSVESKNILTDKERYTYLYDAKNGISLDAYGKELSVEIDGNTYSFIFDDYVRDTLTKPIFILPDGYDEIIVSNQNTYAFYSKSNRRLAYSVTGKSVTSEISMSNLVGNIVGSPKFTQDGSYIVVMTDVAIYIVSVLSDKSDGSFRFPEFTNVSTYASGVTDLWTSDFVLMMGHFDFVTYDDFAIVRRNYVNSKTVVGIYKDETWNTTMISDVNFGPTSLSYSTYYKVYNDDYTLKIDGLIAVTAQSYIALFDAKLQYPRVFMTYDETDPDALICSPYGVRILPDRVVFLTEQETDDEYTKTASYCWGIGDYTSEDYRITSTEYDVLMFGEHDILSVDGSRILSNLGKIYYTESFVSKPLTPTFLIRPVAFTNYPYFFKIKVDMDNNQTEPVLASINFYSSAFTDSLELHYVKDGADNFILPDHFATLDAEYFSVGDYLYISSYREDENGDFELYLPETHRQPFDYPITNLYPISSNEMGIFCENEIWFCARTESGYTYTKSKLQSGVKEGGDVIASYDGSTILFCGERGLLGLSYQDFIASSDQILTALSDNIYKDMKEFCKQPVRLFKYGYWILLYNESKTNGYIYDLRTQSWWPVNARKAFKNVLLFNGEPLLVADRFYEIDRNNVNYYDEDGARYQIDWYVESQKLFFTPNYYKHIVNITFSSVLDEDQEFSFGLDVLNYRKYADSGKPEIISYEIDSTRTFVKRLNYFKVNEFQYRLSMDKDNSLQLPLSLSNITIKYKVQGQVR